MSKIFAKSVQNHAIIACSHKNLNLDHSSKITRFKKIFLIPYSTLDGFSNDTTHFSLQEYIDRPKWSEQKNPFESLRAQVIKTLTKLRKNYAFSLKKPQKISILTVSCRLFVLKMSLISLPFQIKTFSVKLF